MQELTRHCGCGWLLIREAGDTGWLDEYGNDHECPFTQAEQAPLAGRMATEREVIRLGQQLVAEHGLSGLGWKFRIDGRATRRFGQCRYSKREIGISRALLVINTLERVKLTILHEIAHALVGSGHGHDVVWARKCMEIGGNGQQYHGSHNTELVKGKIVGTCPACGQQVRKHRKPRNPRQSCSACGGGRFNERYLLRWTQEV